MRLRPASVAGSWPSALSASEQVGAVRAFDRSLTPDEIMDRLEKRLGPEGRKLFEQFLRPRSLNAA